jgi:VRR-NUC domain
MKPITIREDADTKILHQWLQLRDYWHAHIPNEDPDPKQRARGKAMGVSPGFPDMMILLKNGRTMFIELKRLGAPGARTNQEAWLAQLAAAGHITRVAHGADEAIRMIQEAENGTA